LPNDQGSPVPYTVISRDLVHVWSNTGTRGCPNPTKTNTLLASSSVLLSSIERRKEVTSALLENRFRKDKLEKKQKNISKKGSKDKADKMTQRLEGADDAAFIDGKTQYGQLWMEEHTDNINDELTFRGLEELLLLGWKEKIKALKNLEH
jgi:hypothetical protein